MTTLAGNLVKAFICAGLLAACAPGVGSDTAGEQAAAGDNLGNKPKGSSCWVDFWCDTEAGLECGAGGTCVAKSCTTNKECDGYGNSHCGAASTCLALNTPKVPAAEGECDASYPALPPSNDEYYGPHAFAFFNYEGGQSECFRALPAHQVGSICVTSTYWCYAQVAGPFGVACECLYSGGSTRGSLQ